MLLPNGISIQQALHIHTSTCSPSCDVLLSFLAGGMYPICSLLSQSLASQLMHLTFGAITQLRPSI